MITAVIPVHNRADLLARLLISIQEQTAPFYHVIVVDNASTDEAIDVAQRYGCQIISMGANAGFAAAVNAGWRAASTPWIAVLNSDVELHKDWAFNLLSQSDGASFATGTILDAKNIQVIDGTYDLMSRAGCAWRAGHGSPVSLPSEPVRIVMAPATACLYRRNLLERLNGFDETFGSYLEDVDLGLRCLRAGFEGVYVPDASAWHHGSATLGRWNPRVVRLISRNQIRLISKHYDRALFRRSLAAILTGQLLWGLLALRHGAALAWAAGKIEGMRDFRLRGEPSSALRDFVQSSETEIRARATDSYWRWYFRLTSGVAH